MCFASLPEHSKVLQSQCQNFEEVIVVIKEVWQISYSYSVIQHEKCSLAQSVHANQFGILDET